MNLEKYALLLQKWVTKRVDSYEKEVKKLYEELIKEVLALVGTIYNKYEKDGKLTYADMMKYGRLDSFIKALIIHINTLSKGTQKGLYDLLEEEYKYSYDWMSWAIQKETQAKLKNMKLKAEQIEKSLQNPISGLTLSETLEKKRKDVIVNVKREVTRGLVQGSTYKDMAKSLQTTFENDYTKTIRVVRTETHRVREQATLESAQKAHDGGIIMMKKWLNMKDERVRRTPKANHVTMNGQKISVNGMFDLGNGQMGTAPGMTGYAHHDINCRCLLVYEVVAIEAQTDEKLAKRTFEEYQKAMVG